MKTLCEFFAAAVLIVTIATSLFAGDMHTTITDPQPAPTTTTAEGEMSTTVNGDISTTNSEEAGGDSVVATAVSLVESVLSLL